MTVLFFAYINMAKGEIVKDIKNIFDKFHGTFAGVLKTI